MRFFKDLSIMPRLQAILGLSFIGSLISAYALAHHFNTDEGWCDISATLNCDVVNRGPYSEVAGIPVSLLGVIGFVAVGIISFLALRLKHEREELWNIVKIGIGIALLYSLYLTYLEAFVLTVYCPLCLTSFAAVIAMAVVAFAPPREVK